MVKEILIPYEMQSIITMFIKAHHWILHKPL